MPVPQLEKIFKLVKATATSCIIVDQQGEPQYVVMNFKEFERLADQQHSLTALTEDELLEKINQDIAIWKEKQQPPVIAPPQPPLTPPTQASTPLEQQQGEEPKNPELQDDHFYLNKAKNEPAKSQYDFEPID